MDDFHCSVKQQFLWNLWVSEMEQSPSHMHFKRMVKKANAWFKGNENQQYFHYPATAIKDRTQDIFTNFTWCWQGKTERLKYLEEQRFEGNMNFEKKKKANLRSLIAVWFLSRHLFVVNSAFVCTFYLLSSNWHTHTAII